ncbi:hypothetical protein Nepgr_024198 [Nepenthes gracilis]|uniref:Protein TRIGALACTOSYLDIACYLGLYCEROL 4, chloroplastic n=1 Tax=Nepenthes gracilis TaxID=150966 RepID=A0AAD3T2N9_NEPGR|nr:hypothetical protein Nepgr_024198 [Nepenthes gracilis]
MANLRTSMDAAFGDLNIASPRNLDGFAKAVPGESFPVDGARASRVLRIQQLSFLRNGFPLGVIPSLSPSPQGEHGSFSLQTLLIRPSISDWWLGLVGQFRPKKLISAIKAEVSSVDEWELSAFKDITKHFFDKSLYSIGLYSHIPLPSSSSLLLSSEAHGERKGRQNRLMLFHKLPCHDIMFEAAWPELFVDNNGRYWHVPESISLELASLVSDSGLRYRFGIHKNSGHPQPVNASDTDVPPFLMPGLCAKAAFSYENSRDFWRQRETQDDLIIKTDKGQFRRPAYDVRLKEPHATVSAIVGGTCGAWFGGKENTFNLESAVDSKHIGKKRSPLFADLFGSVCYTFQHGKFRKIFGDLTRVDARLDICSASSFAKSIAKSVFRSSSDNSLENSLSSPRLSVIFQQQVAGPIVFRVDTRCAINPAGSGGLQIEDFMYSLSYSLRLLRSGKVVAWYSPKRKEGMIELRVFEF